MSSQPSIEFTFRDIRAEPPTPSIDGISRTISCGRSRGKGPGKLAVRPILAGGQLGSDAKPNNDPEPTLSSPTNDSIRQAISCLGTQTRKKGITSEYNQKSQASRPPKIEAMTTPVDWPMTMALNSTELGSVGGSNIRSRSMGSAGAISAPNQADEVVRFDLESYVRDLPRIGIALLSIGQYNHLRALGDLGWATDARVSLIDSQQVIFVFSETDDSMSALTALVAITDPSDDDDDAATPTRPLSPSSNDGVIGVPVEEPDLNNVGGTGDDRNVRVLCSGSEGGKDLNLDVPIKAFASPQNLNGVRIRRATLVLTCIRFITLLAVAAWLGAFGLWMFLAYDLLPNLYVAIEQIWLLTLGFLGREVILWALHFAVRKAMKVAASFIRRIAQL
ncbi:hypothetical protein DFP72DRAFT_1078921 [Ephemerocybe angulata]|uniref:Uncharacterized protein n=1 Tax=Ephemerocybe angulata TaxID=980116 RepID=A0A8H6LVI4_9AGAR|nr:hypothetical protein DFP72DRAFT_1078921 [Tulosesus angulatus]